MELDDNAVMWFLDYYPEWVGHSDDDDVRDARYRGMKVMHYALFEKDGALTGNLSDKIKQMLSNWGIDVSAFETDCANAQPFGLCTDEFLMELGIIHFARYFITKEANLQEFKISRSWSVRDRIRVYAHGEDDAMKRAERVYRPSINRLGLGGISMKLVDK